MINLDFEDKHELHALHKALMEAKFHEDPDQTIVQTSPLVARVMHKVVDALEQVNWATEVDKIYKQIEWKNDWREWRTRPNERTLLGIMTRYRDTLQKLADEGQEALLAFLKVLAAPYVLSDEYILSCYEQVCLS